MSNQSKLRAYCNDCGWRKGGVDSWDGVKCKCGHSETITIHFNTKRLYSAHGQRITATLHADGCVTFYDHDRQIDGEFNLLGDDLSQRAVMLAYDHNTTQRTRRSWENAMLRSGCNSKFPE